MWFVVNAQGLYFQEMLNSAGKWVHSRLEATMYNDYNVAQFVAISRDGIVKAAH